MFHTATKKVALSFDDLDRQAILTVLDALPVSAFLLDNESIHCNGAAAALTGYERTELSNSATFFPLLFGSAAEDAENFLRCRPDVHPPAPRDFSINCKDGRLRVVEIAVSGHVRSICTIHDVTDLRTGASDLAAATQSFRRIAEHSTDPFMLIDRAGKIVDANDVCLAAYGYGRDDFLALSVPDLESEETRETAAVNLAVVMEQGHGRLESRHCLREGRVFPVEARLLSLPGLPYVVMFVRDITELKRQEQKRVENEALLKAIIDSVPFDFFALDLEGRYTMLNMKSTRLWGDAVGKTVAEFAEGTDFERYIPIWMDNNRRALAGETMDRDFVFEFQGKERIVREVVAPIRDSQQRTLGSFGINIDITQHKLTQKALRESEERYRRLSELTSDYVYCCVRRDGAPFRVQWLSGAIEAITGYSEADIYQRGCWMEFVHPEDRDRVQNRRMTLPVGGSFTDEFRFICKNGEICWIREFCRCEAGDAEGELRLYGASQNITESKHTELALRNIEEIFRLFLEHSPAYIVFKEENHRVMKLSRNFEALLRRPLEEMIGKTAADFLPHRLAEKIMKEDQIVLRDGKPIQTEEELGGRFYSSTRFAIPQKDKPSLIVAIKTEITARKEAEDALCRLNNALDRRVEERTAQLEAAILEQEAFSYSVSHDLRAPLRHINSFSAILLEDYSELLPDQARFYLGRICKATRRMGLLIDNLLNLSQVSRTVIKPSPVNLSEVAENVISMLKETEPDRVVEVRIMPELLASCDKILVSQLFENLLGNAWKYTAKLPVARIEVGMEPLAEGAVFFIKDNGAGFDMIYQEKLFIPFQRLHGAEFEGNGIGLATAQRIVQRHGGTIWAEGAEGEGATFYFTLP